MKLASFDIFDTTLIRRCGKPENIFYLMAERLYPGDEEKQREFVEWRKKRPQDVFIMRNEELGMRNSCDKREQLSLLELPSEARIMNKVNNGEVMLEEVYFQSIDFSVSELVELEKEIEAENLMVNRVILEEIERRREEGWMIAFISDMYLDAEFLSKILMREGCMKEGDRLFVSSEWGARKDTGELYDVVRRELNPTEWKHWGDNRNSDVKMACSKGVDAVWVRGHYNDFERKMLVEADVRKSELITYSRIARFEGDAYVALAADIVAPCYVAYVKWLLDDARKRGVTRLYFLSRDGYILMKIAENMEHEGIELRYLFLSRRSLYLPYLCGGGKKEYLDIVDRHTLLRRSVNHMLWQLQVDRESLKEMYDIEFVYDKIVTPEQEQDFLNKIFDGGFYNDLQKRAEAEKNILLEYFRQEHILDDTKSAMVDVGWLGTSRLMVNKILDEENGIKIPFYYYGVRGDVFDSSCGEYYAFLTHWLNPSIVGFIENYMSASPYKTTIGYEKVGDRVEPVFDTHQTSCNTKIVDVNVAVCSAIARNIREVDGDVLVWWAKRTMQEFADFSSELDLSPLLDIAMFDDRYFVKKMTKRELFNYLFLGKSITSFDRASLQLTCGYKHGKRLSYLAGYSGRLRGWLFRLLKGIMYYKK